MTAYRDAVKKALEEWGCGCLDVEAALSVVENAIAGAGWCVVPLSEPDDTSVLQKRPAYWTHDPMAGYYFAPSHRTKSPYLKQVEVTAILDVASDGTLAGVELVFGELPPPPGGEE
jgi:hypothetical protein